MISHLYANYAIQKSHWVVELAVNLVKKCMSAGPRLVFVTLDTKLPSSITQALKKI